MHTDVYDTYQLRVINDAQLTESVIDGRFASSHAAAYQFKHSDNNRFLKVG